MANSQHWPGCNRVRNYLVRQYRSLDLTTFSRNLQRHFGKYKLNMWLHQRAWNDWDTTLLAPCRRNIIWSKTLSHFLKCSNHKKSVRNKFPKAKNKNLELFIYSLNSELIWKKKKVKHKTTLIGDTTGGELLRGRAGGQKITAWPVPPNLHTTGSQQGLKRGRELSLG